MTIKNIFNYGVNWSFVIGINILTGGLVTPSTIYLIKNNNQMRLALGFK